MSDLELRNALLEDVAPRGQDYWAKVEAVIAQAGTAQLAEVDISTEVRAPGTSNRWRSAPLRLTAALLICVALIGAVVAASTLRSSENEFADEAGFVGPTLTDHWHAVYGVWDCTLNEGDGGWLDKFETPVDPWGIHSHGDGMIYIHPFTEAATGRNARLGLFVETMSVALTDKALVLDDGRVLSEATTTCRGEPVTIHLRRWVTAELARSGASPEIVTAGLTSQVFRNDREVWVIAVAPLDAEIPLPPKERFDELDNWLPGAEPPSCDDPDVTCRPD